MLAMETGWPPPELLVTVSMTSGMLPAPSRGDQRFERGHVHVALEIQARLRVGGFGDGQIHGARAGEFDVGAGGIEMGVGGDHVARLAHHGEQDALGGAPLVGGNHVAEAGERVGHALQAEEALAAGVGFVAAHHGGPLFGGHGAGAGIGQQVDQDVAGVDEEQVVAGLLRGSARAPRGVVWCSGSTLLMRNGSMMVRTWRLSHWWGGIARYFNASAAADRISAGSFGSVLSRLNWARNGERSTSGSRPTPSIALRRTDASGLSRLEPIKARTSALLHR